MNKMETNDPRNVPIVEAAKQLRKELGQKFPNQSFSARIDRYSMGEEAQWAPYNYNGYLTVWHKISSTDYPTKPELSRGRSMSDNMRPSMESAEQ